MTATFITRCWENQAQTIASFSFKPTGSYRYEAGQYAVIAVPHTAPDNRGMSRTMTLSSSPGEALLKFSCRISDTGKANSSGNSNNNGIGNSSSFKRSLMSLQPGDTVTILDAMGDLVLPLDASIPLVFVAGGIGIASYVGMLQYLIENHDLRQISLHYAANAADDMVFQTLIEQYCCLAQMSVKLYVPGLLKTTYPAVVTHERMMATDIHNSIHTDSLVYLSGPENMVEPFRENLLELGVSNQQIIFDYFEGYISL